jgi:nucleotide-binding universal stress UspA family protein
VLGKIIIGYDGRETADAAVALGVRLAEVTDSEVILAYAYGDDVAGAIRGTGSGTLAAAAQEEAEATLCRGLRLVPYGIAATTLAIPDSPVATVLERLAETEQADLVVIGSSDFGPLSRVLIGSVGGRLLRGAPCAVAIAPAGFAKRTAGPVLQVGVCWDGSPEAHEARDLAVGLARLSNAELHLYTAIQPVPFAQPPYPGVYVPDEKPLREVAEHALSAACRAIPDEILASGRVVSGDPAGALADQAEKDELDLLLLGSRGYGPVRRVLLGGVSQGLIRIARCPVLVVPRSSWPRMNRPPSPSRARPQRAYGKLQTGCNPQLPS